MCVQQERCWKQPSHFVEIHLAFPFALPMCFSQWICHFIFAVTHEFEMLKWSLTKCLRFLTWIKILSGCISNQWYFLSDFLGNMQASRKHPQMCQLQASWEIWWVWYFSHCFADRFTVVVVVWISLSKLCIDAYCSVRWNYGVSGEGFQLLWQNILSDLWCWVLLSWAAQYVLPRLILWDSLDMQERWFWFPHLWSVKDCF